MKPTTAITAALSYLLFLSTSVCALSQAEIEVRKAQPGPEAPLVEIVPRATIVTQSQSLIPPVKETEAAEVTMAPEANETAPRKSPASRSAMSTASSGSSNTYRLRAHDQLEINVFGHADLSGLTTVREDGTVRLKLIQEVVDVGGETLETVENRIRGLLAKDYLRDPRVTVNISKHALMKITIMGRVNQPKTYGVPANQPINLVQAIGLAGGRSNLGNLSKVYLKRGSRVQVYDVAEMIRTSEVGSVPLQDGDIVDVPEKMF